MTLQLAPYQTAGVEWLAGGSRMLADMQRLGKTPQAIRAAHAAGARHMQVISPASVVEQWRREFGTWWPGGPLNLDVTSYAKAERLVGDAFPDVLILDEAHRLKTPTSRRTIAVYGTEDTGGAPVAGLAQCAGAIWPLTGTPAPNHAGEWYTHVRALAPGAITPRGSLWTYEQFLARYCAYRDSGFGLSIVGNQNVDELRDILSTFVLRRTRAEVWKEVPPLRVERQPIVGRVPKTDNRELERVRRALEIEGVEALKRLSPYFAEVRRLTGLAKVKPAAEWAADRLDDSGEKLVLFAYHSEVIDGLVERLAKYRPAKIDGRTPPKRRQPEVDRFMTDPTCRVFVGQTTAAGEGITIPIANTLALVESSWVPGDDAQAMDRIVHRDKREACLAVYLTLAGSIDEDIAKAVARKVAMLSEILS
ncbi:helicase domain-containing protein [Stappia sp. 22II-S9-Z10]|nr:helicase domain-containing protein [Stappia sp. 22II-S9-Z10]